MSKSPCRGVMCYRRNHRLLSLATSLVLIALFCYTGSDWLQSTLKLEEMRQQKLFRATPTAIEKKRAHMMQSGETLDHRQSAAGTKAKFGGQLVLNLVNLTTGSHRLDKDHQERSFKDVPQDEPGSDTDLDAVEKQEKRSGNRQKAPASDIPSFRKADILDTSMQIKINETNKHDKWIVVTSVSLPTDDVKFLSQIPGWKVVVVGDTKTPANWSHPNCVYLSVGTQESLGFRIARRLPYRSYARKNVGYLYAIAHGANVIYETDDDNRPLDKLESFYLSKTSPGLTYAGLSLFNPYKHFGQSTLWPRGYPLGSVGSSQEPMYRLSAAWKTPLIQQGVVNGDPDMDAIFRLTRKRTETALDVHFDPTAPPVFLPEGVFSPFNSQNTLFHYSALWALLLPTTTTFRMCDIWRGYWAQRLLWEIGGHLGFFPPNAYQTRNAHSYMSDAEDEKDMYFDTDRLLDFLTTWKCPEELSFFQCVYKLSADMVADDFWAEEDVEITRLWLEDLIKSGYSEPARVNVTEATLQMSPRIREHVRKASHSLPHHNTKADEESQPSELDLKWAVTTQQGSLVYFTSVEQTPPTVLTTQGGVSKHERSFAKHLSQVAALCPAIPAFTTRTDVLNGHGPQAFHDVLLIVTFNWPFYANAQYIEIMHRNLFPNIVYCGDNATKFTTETKNLGRELSFIEAPVSLGFRGYHCTVRAMQMSYKVRGYFTVGDDTLLNTWNFQDLNKEEIWMTETLYPFNCTAGTNWMWWKLPGGQKEFTEAMAHLRRVSKTQALKSPNLPAFFSYLKDNIGSDEGCVHGLSDVYYVPQTLVPQVTFYLNHFAAYGVMLELAVPMTLYGVQDKRDIIHFRPTNLWLQERLDPWPRYSPDVPFLHPVKLSNLTNLAPLCHLHLTQLLLRAYNTGQR